MPDLLVFPEVRLGSGLKQDLNDGPILSFDGKLAVTDVKVTREANANTYVERSLSVNIFAVDVYFVFLQESDHVVHI